MIAKAQSSTPRLALLLMGGAKLLSTSIPCRGRLATEPVLLILRVPKVLSRASRCSSSQITVGGIVSDASGTSASATSSAEWIGAETAEPELVSVAEKSASAEFLDISARAFVSGRPEYRLIGVYSVLNECCVFSKWSLINTVALKGKESW
jgi:hypothetical protein